MPTLIAAVGVDQATIEALATKGMQAEILAAGQVPEWVASRPEAVLLTEGIDGEAATAGLEASSESSLKIIRIASSAEMASGIGDAMRRHLFGFFMQPLDVDSLEEAIREAQEIPSWSDGIVVLSARPNWLTLCVRCRQYTAERLVRFVNELAGDLLPEEREKIGLAFRDILLNGMEHGAKFDASKDVYVSYLRTERFIMYTVRDPGPGFSFDKLPQAAISNPPDNTAQHLLYRAQQGIRAGGFGLMVARDLVDEMLHNEAGNEVVLIKYPDRPGGTRNDA